MVEPDQVINSQWDNVTVCLDEGCRKEGGERGRRGEGKKGKETKRGEEGRRGEEGVPTTQALRGPHSPSPCSAAVVSSFTTAKRMHTYSLRGKLRYWHPTQ